MRLLWKSPPFFDPSMLFPTADVLQLAITCFAPYLSDIRVHFRCYCWLSLFLLPALGSITNSILRRAPSRVPLFVCIFPDAPFRLSSLFSILCFLLFPPLSLGGRDGHIITSYGNKVGLGYAHTQLHTSRASVAARILLLLLGFDRFPSLRRSAYMCRVQGIDRSLYVCKYTTRHLPVAGRLFVLLKKKYKVSSTFARFLIFLWARCTFSLCESLICSPFHNWFPPARRKSRRRVALSSPVVVLRSALWPEDSYFFPLGRDESRTELAGTNQSPT